MGAIKILCIGWNTTLSLELYNTRIFFVLFNVLRNSDANRVRSGKGTESNAIGEIMVCKEPPECQWNMSLAGSNLKSTSYPLLCLSMLAAFLQKAKGRAGRKTWVRYLMWTLSMLSYWITTAYKVGIAIFILQMVKLRLRKQELQLIKCRPESLSKMHSLYSSISVWGLGKKVLEGWPSWADILAYSILASTAFLKDPLRNYLVSEPPLKNKWLTYRKCSCRNI